MNLKKILFSGLLVCGTGMIFAGEDLRLIRNNDFVEVTQSGLPKAWALSKGGEGGVADEPEGKCLFLICPADGKKTAHFLQTGVRLKGEQEYRLTASFRGDSGSEFSAYVETDKPKWQTKASPWMKCTGDWQELDFKFKFGRIDAVPWLVLRVRGAGKVLVRRAELIEWSTPYNGNFSQGTRGWEVFGGSVTDAGKGFGNVLELNSANETARAVQKGIFVVKGAYYELSYQVRGGAGGTQRDAQNAVWFRVMPVMNGKALATEEYQDCFSEWQKKSIVFQVTENGLLDIVIEAKPPYCADFDNVVLARTKPPVPPVVLLPDEAHAYRNGVYSSNRHLGKAKYTLLNNSLPQAAACEVTFNGSSFKVPMDKSAVFELTLPAEYGVYPVSAAVLDAAGKTLAKTQLDLRVNPPSEREITFRPDHVMLIDGKPFFPLGVWGIKGSMLHREKAKLIAQAGFNTARVGTFEQMDDFAENGMMAMTAVLSSLPEFKDADHFARWDLKYRQGLKKNQDHPSLIGYTNIDEPAWGGYVTAENLLAAYEYIRKADPYRPVMLNEAPRGEIADLRHYAASSDTYGVDIYPVPEPNPHSGLADKNMTSVGKYTDRSREIVYDRKPVWMTLQAFAWGELTNKPQVFPAEHQNRFMAYNAVAHGATGLFYFGFNFDNPENRNFLDTLGKTIRELGKMSPVFVAETVRPSALKASVPEINILHKRLDGADWFIAVNESAGDVTACFTGAGEKPLNVFFENRRTVPVSGSFEDTFKAYDVHIYSAAEKLPPELEKPQTRRIEPIPDIPPDYLNAYWIWYPGKNTVLFHKAWFKQEVTLETAPEKAVFLCAADDMYRMYVNGELVMEGHGWTNLMYRDLSKFFKPGKNVIEIKAADGGIAPCGLIFAGVIREKNGKETKILSGDETMTSEDHENWTAAQVLHKFGQGTWGSVSPRAMKPEQLGKDDFPF